MADNVATIVLTSKETIATTGLTAAQLRTFAQTLVTQLNTLGKLNPLPEPASAQAALVPPVGALGGYVITTCTVT
jgi:hypothetical protein